MRRPDRRRPALAGGPAPLAAVLASVVLLLWALTGCGGSAAGPGPAGPGGDATTGSASDGGASDAAGTGGAAGLSPTDLAWAQLMIPLNDRMLAMLDQVARHGRDPGLRGFADELAASHRTELGRLHALLDDAGVTYTNLHEGHNMPGMVTEEELDDLVRLRGAAFDAAARDHLREHLAESGQVSRAERDAGADDDATTLAAELADARVAQLDELARLGD
ncbi:DUF305 domain-containing protein [Streptomyces sp. B6B3]|uniref:DUF305 domain-containing protein n=1 Tax=Streptomyces sp. B6B3 TaxID=3153570 RepID=UPI00325CCC51